MKEREIGKDPETGKMIIAKHGRFGPYLQLGEWSEEDREAKINKPKMTSIPKDMSAESITLEEAIKLKGVVITSSPFPIPKAFIIKCRAEVPEFTATAYFLFTYCEIALSNFFIVGPNASCPERKTDKTDFIS